jgi:hypothetical protein
MFATVETPTPRHKLGKKAPRHDVRTFALAALLGAELPAPPLNCDWTTKVAVPIGWGLNDELACCTLTSQKFAVQVFTAANGEEITVPDSAIQAAYEGLGYNPAAPLVDDGSGQMVNPTDDGASMLDALVQWRSKGIGGREILAFTKVNPRNLVEVKQAIDFFGGVYTGLALPGNYDDENQQAIWSLAGAGVPPEGECASDPDSGHCVFIPAYTQDNLLTCMTWNGLKLMTSAWLQAHCDEMYAVVTYDWARKTYEAPNGFDMGRLMGFLHGLNRHRMTNKLPTAG